MCQLQPAMGKSSHSSTSAELGPLMGAFPSLWGADLLPSPWEGASLVLVWCRGRRGDSPLEMLSLMPEKVWEAGGIGVALPGWCQVGLPQIVMVDTQ